MTATPGADNSMRIAPARSVVVTLTASFLQRPLDACVSRRSPAAVWTVTLSGDRSRSR
jgi:hypothetical protein